MKKKRNSKKQLHKKKYRVILGFLTSFVLLCLASSALIAKYYAGRSNKGVATASSLYFFSNFLKNVQELEENDYPAIYNNDAWDGNSQYDFNLSIRNYQNQLLYNDKNLDITYKISFQLEGTSDGGTYQVTYKDETKTITANEACEFTAELTGGQAMSNQFIVSVARPTGNTDVNYKSTGIRVTATPVSPGYVANSVKLGGIFYASLVSVKYELNGGFSKVTDVSQYAGFPYTITYKPGEDNTAHTVKITWDASKLQLDKNSPYYGSKHDSENSKQYIEILIEPYAALDLVFYRASGFSGITQVNELNALVEIFDKDKTEGGAQ